jgi:hypothetical protein
MKVSIAFLPALCLLIGLQGGLLAAQTSTKAKTPRKPPAKTTSTKKRVPEVQIPNAPKVTSPQKEQANVKNTNPVLVARESLLKSGDDIPAYKVLRYSDGKSIELSTLMAELAVLVIYHPGSKPAVRALPQIVTTATKIKPGIKVYALCVRTEEAQWKASVTALPAVAVPLWDPCGRTDVGMNARKVNGVEAYPTIIVTDKNGKVRDAFAGWFSGDRRLAPLLKD